MNCAVGCWNVFYVISKRQCNRLGNHNPYLVGKKVYMNICTDIWTFSGWRRINFGLDSYFDIGESSYFAPWFHHILTNANHLKLFETKRVSIHEKRQSCMCIVSLIFILWLKNHYTICMSSFKEFETSLSKWDTKNVYSSTLNCRYSAYTVTARLAENTFS